MIAHAVLMLVFEVTRLGTGLGLAIWNLMYRSKAPEEHYRRDL